MRFRRTLHPHEPPAGRGLLARLSGRPERRPLQLKADLVQRLREIARARRLSPERLAEDLLTRALQQERRRARVEAALAELTPRQREVIWLAARGRTNRQIADALVISIETVKTHLHLALQKLNLHSKSDLRLLLLDLGLRWWQR